MVQFIAGPKWSHSWKIEVGWGLRPGVCELLFTKYRI